MGVIVLDDRTASLEITVYSELFDARRALLKEDALVFVTGKVRGGDDERRLAVIADDIVDLASARAQAFAALTIQLDEMASVARLRDALAPYRAAANGSATIGGCRVVLQVANGRGSAILRLPDAWRVRGEQRLLDELRAQPHVRGAEFSYD
jgi:DNA polymerase-3 subunit alpha